MKSLIRKILKEDFDWINDVEAGTPMPHDETKYQEKSYEIINKNLEGVYFGKWYLEQDFHSGAIEWHNPESNYVIYATPHWDDFGKLPIDVTEYDELTGEEEYANVGDFNIPRFNTEEQAVEWYTKTYPKLVLDEIKKSGIEL